MTLTFIKALIATLTISFFVACAGGNSPDSVEIPRQPLPKGERKPFENKVAKVEVKNENGQWKMYRNGAPYYVNGVGGWQQRDYLIASGGNSVRTWGVDEYTLTLLDSCAAQGITVHMGLWIDHERHLIEDVNARKIIRAKYKELFNVSIDSEQDIEKVKAELLSKKEGMADYIVEAIEKLKSHDDLDITIGYDNDKWFNERFEFFKKQILSVKDHPALLMWGIGNEVQTDHYLDKAKGEQVNFKLNPKVWMMIGKLAKFIKEVDGNHPTSTIVYWPEKPALDGILKYAPDLDVLGLNAYGGIGVVFNHARDNGWTKSTIVTEYGPNGHWEAGKTKWGAYLEDNSTSKAMKYKKRTQQLTMEPTCLGGYAFLWGEKQERTKTWYGLIFNGSDVTAGADELAKVWSGKYPANRAPILRDFKINNHFHSDNVKLKAGSSVSGRLNAYDKEDKKNLVFVFELMRESQSKKIGGEKEDVPEIIKGSVTSIEEDGSFTFTVPQEKGQYRMFGYVYDQQGKVGHANFPILSE